MFLFEKNRQTADFAYPNKRIISSADVPSFLTIPFPAQLHESHATLR